MWYNIWQFYGSDIKICNDASQRVISLYSEGFVYMMHAVASYYGGISKWS